MILNPVDAADRVEFAHDMMRLLYGADPEAGIQAPMAVVPAEALPRLAIPPGNRAAGAEAVRCFFARKGRLERVAGHAAVIGIRAGLYGREKPSSSAAPADTINGYLTEILKKPVDTVLLLGNDRANRKPVLQVFGADRDNEYGKTIAWAKVGVGSLAAGLVTQEAATLNMLSGQTLTYVNTPQVRSGSWRGMPVMVTSPLAPGRAPDVRSKLIVDAAQEISLIRPPTDVSDQPYLNILKSRVHELSADRKQWHETAYDMIAGKRKLRTLKYGATHGDFAPWNVAANGTRLNVWDWERFTIPAPVGFDLLHYGLSQYSQEKGVSFAEAAKRVVAEAPSLLEPLDVTAEDAVTTALLHLLEISSRYDGDGRRAKDTADQTRSWALNTIETTLGVAA